MNRSRGRRRPKNLNLLPLGAPKTPKNPWNRTGPGGTIPPHVPSRTQEAEEDYSSYVPLTKGRGCFESQNSTSPYSLTMNYTHNTMLRWVKPSRASHFTMSNEDFPALPGTASATVNPSSDNAKGQGSSSLEHSAQSQDKISTKSGIITNPDGTVSNIPSSMVSDQFGMVGLLTFIRVAESDPNLVSLALGFDLTALGLNLNATESLFPFFGGPWGEGPVRAEDVAFNVPQEYNISDPNREGQEFTTNIRDKLLPLKIAKYKDELLFYLFYTYTGDGLQILAASELYNRDWRYHKEEKVWICRAPGVIAIEKGQNYERGTYYFFDPISWRKVGKEFYLEYDKLEDRPVIPTTFLQSFPMGS